MGNGWTVLNSISCSMTRKCLTRGAALNNDSPARNDPDPLGKPQNYKIPDRWKAGSGGTPVDKTPFQTLPLRNPLPLTAHRGASFFSEQGTTIKRWHTTRPI